MTALQKIQLRLSEIRTKLSELGAVEGDLTAEQTAEIGTLRTEYQSCETRSQALMVAEPVEPETTEETPDAEARALETLVEQANAGDVFAAAVDHRQGEGATAELQQHHGLAGNVLPLSLLRMPDPELRAVTPAPANVGANQQGIIPYVFPQSAAAWLGIPQPSVPVGEAIYPVLATEPTVVDAAENASVPETTGSFTADALSPRRLQASFFYSREDRARFAMMDASLRQALSDGLGSGLDKAVLAGATAGLLGAAGLTARTGDAAAEATFATYRGLLYDALTIEGSFAAEAMDVRLLVGAKSYEHAASKYRTATSDESALDSLMARCAGVRVSGHVPAPDSNDQSVLVRKGMAMDAVSPVWEGVQLVPDEVTKAATGQIVITAIMLYAFKLLRSDGFQHRKVQLA